ncbi:MAG: hypothetical protein FJ308_20560 [Planctomycetes bacterium]|nr:hypothetical protein [Planctomycetota bacterium]
MPPPFVVIPSPLIPEKFSCRHVHFQVRFSTAPTTDITLEARVGTTGGTRLSILPESIPTKPDQPIYDINAVIWGDESQLNDPTFAIIVGANHENRRVSVMPIES